MITKVLKFLTLTSIFIGINGLIVILFSSHLYNVQLKIEILVITFLITFSAYSLNKATDKSEDSINRPEIVSIKRVFYVGPSIIAIILSLVIGAFMGFWALIILITSVILTIVYSIQLPFLTIRLKEVTGLKSFTVAFSWAFVGALLPATMQSVSVEKIILAFFYIFIQIIVNTILFDILDMKGDRVSGLITIPILLGLKKTKKLLISINSLLIILIAICMIEGVFKKNLLTLSFGIFYGYLLIWMFSSPNSNRLLAELLIDGEWIPIITLMN
jgi:4-hydroxybenzoate polyprenyltransferase